MKLPAGSTSKNNHRLDSFALLAFLRDEPGTKRVRKLLRDAAQQQVQLYMSLINYGELLYIVERRLGATELRRVIAYLDNLPRSRTGQAAHIKAHHSISFANSFAAALALEFDAPTCHR